MGQKRFDFIVDYVCIKAGVVFIKKGTDCNKTDIRAEYKKYRITIESKES